MTRKAIFDAIRATKGSVDADDVVVIDAALDRIGFPSDAATSDLTARAVCYCASEEGLVREAYKDGVNVWTWALGVTNASGHEVYPRYKDNPQSLEKCVEVSVWLMQNTYLPPVLKAFEGYALKDHELAAALSFHWNTGAILTTNWVKLVKEGERSQARTFLETHYLNNGTLKARRLREAALFFDGEWPSLKVPVYPVSKPSYSPAWGKGEMIDLLGTVEAVL